MRHGTQNCVHCWPSLRVDGVPKIAEENHLRRVYEKTGTSRQLNLTKIIAQFSNPLLE
jgi:hypothetical protein